jgi:hypothetical protein
VIATQAGRAEALLQPAATSGRLSLSTPITTAQLRVTHCGHICIGKRKINLSKEVSATTSLA